MTSVQLQTHSGEKNDPGTRPLTSVIISRRRPDRELMLDFREYTACALIRSRLSTVLSSRDAPNYEISDDNNVPSLEETSQAIPRYLPRPRRLCDQCCVCLSVCVSVSLFVCHSVCRITEKVTSRFHRNLVLQLLLPIERTD